MLARLLKAHFRSTKIHTVSACIMITLSLISVDTYASIQTMGEAINIAGRQRMLSQRIAQAYLLIGIQPESQRGSVLLERSATEFAHNLKDLKAFTPAKSIINDLYTVEKNWLPYRAIAEGHVSKESAPLMMELSNKVLASAHAYVGKLEMLSGTKKAEFINVSGRQRMLSQRIAKNFLAKHWKVNSDLSTEALFEDLAEYENMLDYLISSDINTPRINTQLQKVKGQLSYATKGFDGIMSLSGKRLVHVVTGTTDNMLRGMNITTGLYAELLSNQTKNKAPARRLLNAN